MLNPQKIARVPLFFSFCALFMFLTGFLVKGYSQTRPIISVHSPYPTIPQIETPHPVGVNVDAVRRGALNQGVQYQGQIIATERDVSTNEHRLSSRVQVAIYMAEFNNEVKNTRGIYRDTNNIAKPYWMALRELETMSSTSTFSISRAVYLVENAFFNNRLPADKFQQLLNNKLTLCHYIMQKEKLDTSSELSRHYALQKLFSDTITYYNPITRAKQQYTPLGYDFDDYMGKEHWENMFVTKLLLTGKGQCHSMPLLYLMLAEQLGIKATLAQAPEHSFIVFYNKDGKRYNFETTSGNLVSYNWLMQSGFINASAIKKGTYLDTLSQKKLIAYLIMDLTQGYLRQYEDDGFVYRCLQDVKALHSDNLEALMMEANNLTIRTRQAIRAVGNPPPNKLPEYREAYSLFQQRNALYQLIDDLGYQAMPPEAYQAWRKSVEQEKQRRENKDLKAQIRQQIGRVSNIKTTIIHK
ncbi:hypothetical protein CLV59_103627 [Chitinophaga dinghuensis]|uniref:Transglutaminase superfamily protein n=1 Tax=Chitinophaga dinghuensis TaxID=1539050 RepID=A0A327W5K1_9BACT|nr:hypothetical protein [Chitinophaga dinghuensis]RAJ83656.1 hypothetical protein CLV59_103627 [Chitinophaga dinghuensis]